MTDIETKIINDAQFDENGNPIVIVQPEENAIPVDPNNFA